MRADPKVKYIVLAVLAAASAAVGIVGVVQGSEGLIASGIVPCFFSLFFIPVFVQNDRKTARRMNGEPLARWEYSYAEAEQLAARLIAQGARSRRGIAILLFVCLVILVLPFFFLLPQSGEAVPSFVYLLLVCLPLLPWLVLLAQPPLIRSRVLTPPTITTIARDSLVVGNTVHPINNREEVKLCAASLLRAQDGMANLKLTYKVATHTRYSGLSRGSETVLVPVPAHEEASARAIADSFGKASKKQ